MDTSDQPKRKKGWGRKLSIVAGGFFLLLVISYFVVTSGAFLKAVILPRAAEALNSDISVASAEISPLSSVVLRQIKITPKGAEPLLTADEVRVRYKLFSILGGKIEVEELALVSPTIQIIEQADGTGNLQKALSKSSKAGKPSPESTSEKSIELNIRNVSVTHASLKMVKTDKTGTKQTTQVNDLNLSVDRLQNSQPGKFTFSGDVQSEILVAPGRTNASSSSLMAKLTSSFDYAVDAKVMPQTVKGTARFDVSKAEGGFKELTGLGGTLNCELTPTELRQLSLKFEQSKKTLGQVQISGPLDIQKQEGRLTVQASSIDRQVLNLFGASMGLDFGQTTINARTLIDVSQKGMVIAADGQLGGTNVGIVQNKQSTPPLDLEINYQFTADLGEKTALLRALRVQAKDGPMEIMRGTLDRPMNLNWGGKAPGFKESAFHLVITNLNLANWALFVGNTVPTGRVNMDLTVLAQQDGQLLKLDAGAQLEDLTVILQTNKLDHAQVQFSLKGEVEELKNIKIESYQFDLQREKQMLVTAKGGVNYEMEKKALSIQTTLEAALPALVKQFPVSQVTATSGALKLSATYSQKLDRQNLAGNILLTDYTGGYGDYHFKNHELSWDYRVELNDQILQVQRAALVIREGFDSGGSFDVVGQLDMPKKIGQFTFKSLDLNEHALRPFLASRLDKKSLKSVSLGLDGSLKYDAAGQSSIKTDLSVTNLIATDPEKRLPTEPLAASFQIEASQRGAAIQLQRFGISLSPTERAKNQLDAQGSFDFGKTNPAPSTLNVKAESLDLTSFYDIFSGGPKTNVVAEKKPAVVQPSSADKEPGPIELPIKQLAIAVDIGRLYLHEIALTNWQTNLKLNAGRVDIAPFKLTLNGAPINATAGLNLGVPGYQYDFSFTADAIPLQPIVNSLQPDRKGQVAGTLSAVAKVKGAGTSGTALQKNLAAQVDITSTNLNLSIDNVRDARLKSIINVVASIPEIMHNPAGAVGNLLGRLTGAPAQNSNWVDDLKKSPIDSIAMHGSAANGRIDLKEAFVQSPAFQAHAQGAITLANELTNSSLKIPVSISLNRTVAGKIGLLPADSPTNILYIKLPDFFTEEGTLGSPKAVINYLALAGVAAKLGGNLPQSLGTSAGKSVTDLLGAVGNLAAPQPGKAAPNSPTTPATNKPPADQKQPNTPLDPLLDLIKKPKK